MSKQAGQNSVSLVENQPFIDIRNARMEGVSIDATARDSANTPTTQLRRGLVVGYDSAGANYIDASDAAVDAHTYGSHTSAEAPDGDWDGTTIAFSVPGQGTFTHTWGSLGTSISNLATAILDINGTNAGAFVLASASGANLLLTAIRPGVTLSITPSLATAYAGGAAEATSDGALVKYGILLDPIVSMFGIDDAAEDKNATIVTANAIVRSSDLLELTTAAKIYFEANDIKLV